MYACVYETKGEVRDNEEGVGVGALEWYRVQRAVKVGASVIDYAE
jgi:hypothetical protein